LATAGWGANCGASCSRRSSGRRSCFGRNLPIFRKQTPGPVLVAALVKHLQALAPPGFLAVVDGPRTTFPFCRPYRRPRWSCPPACSRRCSREHVLPFCHLSGGEPFHTEPSLLPLKAGSVSMVATDGHRLALVEQQQAVAGLATELRLLIPRRALGELYRIITEATEEATVNIASEQRHCSFQWETVCSSPACSPELFRTTRRSCQSLSRPRGLPLSLNDQQASSGLFYATGSFPSLSRTNRGVLT
jgi:DNA polymerase III beta subunit, central domain